MPSGKGADKVLHRNSCDVYKPIEPRLTSVIEALARTQAPCLNSRPSSQIKCLEGYILKILSVSTYSNTHELIKFDFIFSLTFAYTK